MSSVSEKLTYLNDTKSLLKDVINYSGAGITNATTFRNYAVKLYDAYVEILKDKYVLLDGLPKGTQTGTQISITNAVDLPVYEFELEKESSQETTTGKNLLKTLQLSQEITVNGVTATPVFDSKGLLEYVNINGTATAVTTIPIASFVPEVDISYKVNGSPSDSTISNAYIYVTGSIISYGGNDNNGSWSSTGDKSYQIIVANGATINNMKFYPMIRLATITDPTYEPYTNGASPNPDYPQEVKTVKGYENLFSSNIGDYTNVGVYKLRDLDTEDDLLNISFIDKDTSINISGIYIGFSYTTTPNDGYIWSISSGNIGSNLSNIASSGTNVGKKCPYVVIYPYTEDAFNRLNARYYIQIVKGNEVKPYVPYGSNYVDVNISDGININQVPIPLNNNEIAGIGNYLDELIVDKTGHVYLNKKTGKVVFNGTENWNYDSASTLSFKYVYSLQKSGQLCFSNYFKGIALGVGQTDKAILVGTSGIFIHYNEMNGDATSFKTWLSTHNTEVYYVLATENLIDLNTTVDIELFKGANTITNSEGANMRIRYVEDIEDLL